MNNKTTQKNITPEEADDSDAYETYRRIRLERLRSRFTKGEIKISSSALAQAAPEQSLSTVIKDAGFIGYLAPHGKFESYTMAEAEKVDYHHSFLVDDLDAYDLEGSLTFVRYGGEPIITIKGTPAIDPYSPESSLMISKLARALVATGCDPMMPFFIDHMGFTHAEAPYQEKEIGLLVEWAARNQDKMVADTSTVSRTRAKPG